MNECNRCLAPSTCSVGVDIYTGKALTAGKQESHEHVCPRSDDTSLKYGTNIQYNRMVVILNESILYTSVYIDTEDCIVTILLNFSILYISGVDIVI